MSENDKICQQQFKIDAAEQSFDDIILDKDHFKCPCCGTKAELWNAFYPSPDPFSDPCCSDCGDKILKSWKKVRKERLKC